MPNLQDEKQKVLNFFSKELYLLDGKVSLFIIVGMICAFAFQVEDFTIRPSLLNKDVTKIKAWRSP